MPNLIKGNETLVRNALNKAYSCNWDTTESVAPAIGAFLGAQNPKQALQIASSLGGRDNDTIGTIDWILSGRILGNRCFA